MSFILVSTFPVDTVNVPWKPILIRTILTTKRVEINLVIKRLNNNYLTDQLQGVKNFSASKEVNLIFGAATNVTLVKKRTARSSLS